MVGDQHVLLLLGAGLGDPPGPHGPEEFHRLEVIWEMRLIGKSMLSPWMGAGKVKALRSNRSRMGATIAHGGEMDTSIHLERIQSLRGKSVTAGWQCYAAAMNFPHSVHTEVHGYAPFDFSRCGMKQ